MRSFKTAVVAIAALAATAAVADAKPGPPFIAHVHKLTPAMQQTMTGVSWKPGCPVGLDDLRVIRMRYRGFDAKAHMGMLIVNADVAEKTVRAFGKLYDARFPIRRMEPVDAYGGSDDASMAADNTSAFNCRFVGGTSRWSMHAFGAAIDVNPLENPYVRGSTVSPPAGRAYLDRSRERPGMAVRDGVLVRAFAAAGWKWGASFGDYQHFSTTGR
jgi:D-alanyl-D-alanine carboxypeptidase